MAHGIAVVWTAWRGGVEAQTGFVPVKELEHRGEGSRYEKIRFSLPKKPWRDSVTSWAPS